MCYKQYHQEMKRHRNNFYIHRNKFYYIIFIFIYIEKKEKETKILIDCISDKGIVPRRHKELLQLN